MADYSMSSYAVRKRSNPYVGGGPSKRSKYAFSSNPARRNNPRRFVPGRDRRGGAYGRYNRPGAQPSELKFFDTTLGFLFDATGEVPATGQLCLIPQGTTDATRIGRKAVIKSIQIKGQVTMTPNAAATASTTIFLYVVLDRQCNGAAASATDIWTSNAPSTAFLNLDNSERFKILKKWVIDMTPQAGATTVLNTQQFSIEWYKKLNIPITWDSTAGAITEIRSNNIFLYAGTYNQDDMVSMNGGCRLRFVG